MTIIMSSSWFMVISGLCQSFFPLETEGVSVGENDAHVTAGYGHHKGERRLLLLPTFLIHLIIWPSWWLKACCTATWHNVTPTPLSDESFVHRYQSSDLWEIDDYFSHVPTSEICILKPGLDTLKTIMRMMQAVKHQSSLLCCLHTYKAPY